MITPYIFDPGARLDLPADLVHRFVIVDWSSQEASLRSITRGVMQEHAGDKSRQVDYVGVGAKLDWKLASAVNVGVFGAGGGSSAPGVQTEFFIKVDCDTRLDPNFIAENDLRTLASTTFLTPDSSYARDENDRHLNGVIVARTEHFRRVNGGGGIYAHVVYMRST